MNSFESTWELRVYNAPLWPICNWSWMICEAQLYVIVMYFIILHVLFLSLKKSTPSLPGVGLVLQVIGGGGGRTTQWLCHPPIYIWDEYWQDKIYSKVLFIAIWKSIKHKPNLLFNGQ